MKSVLTLSHPYPHQGKGVLRRTKPAHDICSDTAVASCDYRSNVDNGHLAASSMFPKIVAVPHATLPEIQTWVRRAVVVKKATMRAV